MKRDARFRGLSSEHHHALVLSRALAQRAAAGTVDAALVRTLRARFDGELAPHFLAEEEVLLPALAARGDIELVRRVEEDHAFLRAAVGAAEGGDHACVAAFAERLAAHVRFEERELFPRCEEGLPADVLDALGRRS